MSFLCSPHLSSRFPCEPPPLLPRGHIEAPSSATCRCAGSFQDNSHVFYYAGAYMLWWARASKISPQETKHMDFAGWLLLEAGG